MVSVVENNMKTKASSVDTKGFVCLSLIFLMIVTGLIVALIVLGSQVQSLKGDNHNLEQHLIGQKNITKGLKIGIQKMTNQRANNEKILKAQIKSLLYDIKELKEELKLRETNEITVECR